MKKIYLPLVVFYLFGIASYADNSLEGSWKLIQMSCGSGAMTNLTVDDPITDEKTLTFNNGQVFVTWKSPKEECQLSTSYDYILNESNLTFSNKVLHFGDGCHSFSGADKSWPGPDENGSIIIDNDLMTYKDSELSSNGYCPKNDTIIALYRRIPRV